MRPFLRALARPRARSFARALCASLVFRRVRSRSRAILIAQCRVPALSMEKRRK